MWLVTRNGQCCTRGSPISYVLIIRNQTINKALQNVAVCMITTPQPLLGDYGYWCFICKIITKSVKYEWRKFWSRDVYSLQSFEPFLWIAILSNVVSTSRSITSHYLGVLPPWPFGTLTCYSLIYFTSCRLIAIWCLQVWVQQRWIIYGFITFHQLNRYNWF